MKKKLFSEIPYLRRGRVELKKLDASHAAGLEEMRKNPRVYRYLPTFLFEQKYEDVGYVIDHLYDECRKESIILGVFYDGEFAGLAEMYGYMDAIHKISIGCRLTERYWGCGIASEVVFLLVDYLYEETDIKIITASNMVENQGSANVLKKTGFDLVDHAVEEDWGYETPTIADKWIR